jgi:hypothetical protein
MFSLVQFYFYYFRLQQAQLNLAEQDVAAGRCEKLKM